MSREPSVLDYFKARLRFWRRKILNLSAEDDTAEELNYWAVNENAASTLADQASIATANLFPWRVLLALGLGLLGQLSLEPHQTGERVWQAGFTLYVLAALILIWSHLRDEVALQSWNLMIYENPVDQRFLRSSVAFLISLALALLTFALFNGNRFTLTNLTTWGVSILTMVYAFWQTHPEKLNWRRGMAGFLSRPRWNISLDRSIFLVLALIGVVLFFRIYRLSDIPSQMISDHAEKLWDVGDVLNGQTSLYFSRNTGREFFQFYLTAGIIRLFETGLTFMSLKIGTVLVGLFTLYYMFLLGREIGGFRVGLFVLFFAGIAYWPNLISRYGLRFPLYPLFYAPALYYLVRALGRRNRNDFILSALFLGLGLHGYSPFRIVPFVILLATGLYLLHAQSMGFRRQALWGLFAIIVISLIVFLPLLRYMLENPDIVAYRAMTRMGDLERSLPGPAWQIFLQNLRNSLTMFSWDNGEIWPISIPHRPVLDVVTSVLFHLGIVLLVVRYIRQRHWFDIFTLVSIPVLMMPSILSLAFPGENPSLNRSAAAIIPVFLVVGLAFDGFITALESVSALMWNKRFAWAIGAFLLIWASLHNYDLVFNRYKRLYDASAWNTTEMGAVVRDFTGLTGSDDTAWLVGYPHWVDSRLVMINAGFPGRDNAIWPDGFQGTLADPRPKLFLVNINDTADVDALQALYPEGWLTEYQSNYEGKNFLLFFVPPR